MNSIAFVYPLWSHINCIPTQKNEEFLPVLLIFGVSHGIITINKVVNYAKMWINMQQQSSGCP